MRQITIYIEDDLETKIRTVAKSMHLSQQIWITRVLQEKVQSQWPNSVKRLAGAWEDFPMAEELRYIDHSDSRREAL